MSWLKSIWRQVVRCSIVGGLLLWHTADLWAANGNVTTLPTNPQKSKSGLEFTVDSRGISANGYRPIVIHFKNRPAVPAIADRRLEVLLRPNVRSSRFGEADVTVSHTVEISEGNLGVRKTMLVPQSQFWSSLGVEVYERGRQWKELSQAITVAGNNTYSEAIPTILIVDADAPVRDQRRSVQNQAGMAQSKNLPDVGVLYQCLPDPSGAGTPWSGGPSSPNSRLSQGSGDVSTLQNVKGLDAFELLHPSELPSNWLEYSTVDMVFILFDDLQQLIDKDTARWTALRSWLAAGPTLCVYGLGANYEFLEELESLVGLTRTKEAERRFSGKGKWTVATTQQYLGDIRSFKKLKNWRNGGSAPAVMDQQRKPLPEIPIFAMRDYSLGRIVVFGADEIFPGDSQQWNCLFNAVPTRSWMWYQRHGISLRRLNRDYWKFLIMGVGLAPVKTFVFLISVFALLIGPVNYTFLRRWRKIYLLMVTVPVGAAMVTICLFAWALLADGLGSRVRIRSFTEIDQRTGRTVCWSRHSYYAGMVPSDGLTFPADVVVFPIEHIPLPGTRRRLHRELRWTADGEQNYCNGYMQSRVTCQWLVGRSRETSLGVRLLPSKDGGPPGIVNQLGVSIHLLLWRDADGNYFSGESIAQAETSSLEAIDFAEATSRWLSGSAGHAPAFPPGYDETISDLAFGRASAYYAGWTIDDQAPEPTMETGVLEVAFDHLVRGGGIELPSSSYLAMVDRHAEIPLGIESVQEEASFHVVRGVWEPHQAERDARSAVP
ncbi:MAG: hypothetical protein MK179_13455 [Pirellulaceae bacterium]|nr:hypothetical protein [Pirellulaceae bacterium]